MECKDGSAPVCRGEGRPLQIICMRKMSRPISKLFGFLYTGSVADQIADPVAALFADFFKSSGGFGWRQWQTGFVDMVDL